MKIGQRVSVAPLSEEEEAHKIEGIITKVLKSSIHIDNNGASWFVVLLDNHLYGMDTDDKPIIEVPEDQLTLI